ncbi:hypothetical protein B0T26DRAFT_670806 [Lasiosphaeria miniovina]|uniref:BHLH domain-containing protein n=1 Tax=Lasiosphaeria miniovina TaxID=1954250 RepID=A0AA40BHW3_9PEZI|nr:uncharacterized protein B0T26DRAFT_670806 [Lasiosphaeria miniovina]KAK0734517.1 hypothetical protein B0T26DRAFT_670806 [Lasiosphaeria miniovina]
MATPNSNRPNPHSKPRAGSSHTESQAAESQSAMNQDQDWYGQAPSQPSEEPPYQYLMPQDFDQDALAESRTPAWINGETSSPALYHDRSSHEYLAPAGSSQYGNMEQYSYSSGTASGDPATASFGHSVHDGSSVGSTWAPITPTTPLEGDGLTSYFHGHPGSVSYAGSAPASPAGVETVPHGWVNITSYVHHAYSGLPEDHTAPLGDFSQSRSLGYSLAGSNSTRTLSNNDGSNNDGSNNDGSNNDGSNNDSSEGSEDGSARTKKSRESQTKAGRESQRAKSNKTSEGGKSPPSSRRRKAKQSGGEATAAVPGPPPGPALRTAARRTRRTQGPMKPGESPQQRLARTNHNQVEKQYRGRLHQGFELLLKALPEAEGEGGAGAGEDGASSPTSSPNRKKRLSKYEVVRSAGCHILSLEDEVKGLRRKVELLTEGKEVPGESVDNKVNRKLE